MTTTPDAVATAQARRVDPIEATDGERMLAYRIGARSRALEEHIVRLVSRGEVKFAIWGPGEEVHGTATALALHKAVDPKKFGIVPHYRSGSLCSTWCTLNGVDDFTLKMLRQQFSKGSDTMSGGRQMVYHLNLPEVGILPVQSPVGMQLGKAAGYALGMKLKGIDDGVAMAIIGDGTSAEGDLHDAMNATAVWNLPLIIVVTDNRVAISTKPEEGRGIRDFEAYAKAFGLGFYTCDGRDFDDVYGTTFEAATHVRKHQRGCILLAHSLPRFNGHSSAADVTFDLSQDDPLIALGADLVARGLMADKDRLKRIKGEGRDFFSHHELGAIMGEEDAIVRTTLDQVRAEADPDPGTLLQEIYAPFPEDPETVPGPGTTNISYAGAIRAALDKLIDRKGGFMLGQDVGRLGGVMQASAGIKGRHPGKIIDSPLNEPLIVGVSTGVALHDGLMALPEIQFGDYSLNAFHWLVYLGNLRWSNLGKAKAKLMLRMPVDPFGGGAMYHSMSLDGYFAPIPGLVLLMPSTSFDIHGLMLTAGDYDGPVVLLEPKWMYRQTLGPAFPGEPQDAAGVAELKKRIMRGEVPELPDVRVPFGKGVVRRAGTDLTIVSWGRAMWTSVRAAEALEKDGISAEVIDLRTLVPPDLELVKESVGRTGRLIVAAEDRNFAGFVRSIQGAVVDELPGTPTRALGQKNVPGIAQSLLLEEHTILTDADIAEAARALVATKTGTARAGWDWVPPRYFVG
jgi:2-oxoisovalerate dehydrogenase E1 component